MSFIPIYLNPYHFKNSSLQTASLDRIDSSKGYTIDNVWWIHKQLNWMKWDLTIDRINEIAGLILERYNNETT